MKVNFQTHNPYFAGGLKKNLRRGEVVLDEFRKEFPYIKSSTMWRQRAKNMKDKDIFVSQNAEISASVYSDKICKMRETIYSKEISKKNKSERASIIKDEIKKNGCANCGEIVRIMSDELDQKGIEHKNIKFYVTRGKNQGSDHVFILIGADEDADIARPSTWGQNAVVVDGWRNFVLSVPDAIREYEEFYKVNNEPNIFIKNFVFREFHITE